MNFIIFMCMETEEQKKIDIVLDKYLEDKQSYEETIERMANEDYQRWLGLIRPEYMDRYIDRYIEDYIKTNITVKLESFEYGELSVEVFLKNKRVITESVNIINSIKDFIDASGEK